jgi:chemotaxis protein CheD
MRTHLPEPQYLALPEAGGLAPAEPPRDQVYLYPGQVFASAKPARITTILGSCIAVCLFDATRRVGGMNHFMLPYFAGNGVASARFGNIAMTELLAKLSAAGARIPLLQARVFGGSCMFAPMKVDGHLGQKNEQFAREALAARGIRVIETETGGGRGRKLVFHTDEGKTWLTSI